MVVQEEDHNPFRHVAAGASKKTHTFRKKAVKTTVAEDETDSPLPAVTPPNGSKKGKKHSKKKSPAKNKGKDRHLLEQLSSGIKKMARAVLEHPERDVRNHELLRWLRKRFVKRRHLSKKQYRQVHRSMALMSSIYKCSIRFDSMTRVKRCVKRFLAIDRCDRRYPRHDGRHRQCVEDAVDGSRRRRRRRRPSEECNRRQRHAEFLLRRREDRALQRLREKASECDSLECSKRLEEQIAEQETEVQRKRDRRRSQWATCPDGDDDEGEGGRSDRSQSDVYRSDRSADAFPLWSLVLLIMGLLLLGLLIIFIVYICYKRKQQKAYDQVTVTY